MDDHHALSCHLHSGLRTVRHNQVVDALADFLIAAFPTATVSKEHALSNTGGRGRVADIYLASGPSTYIIDVSVVNTGGKSYIDFGSAEFPGVAGNKRAADKRTLYSQLNLTNVVIIPFVIEAAGRWSKEATTFLQTTCGVQLPSALTAYQLMLRKKTLRRRINCVIAKTNSVIWTRFCGDITPAVEQVPFHRALKPPLELQFLRTRQTSHMNHIPPNARKRILSRAEDSHQPASFLRPPWSLSCGQCYEADWERFCPRCPLNLCSGCFDSHLCHRRGADVPSPPPLELGDYTRVQFDSPYSPTSQDSLLLVRSPSKEVPPPTVTLLSTPEAQEEAPAPTSLFPRTLTPPRSPPSPIGSTSVTSDTPSLACPSPRRDPSPQPLPEHEGEEPS